MTPRIHQVREPQARGMIFIHSTPAALCPHVEWGIGGVLGTGVHMEWTNQPAEPGSRRSEFAWTARHGTGAVLASTLAGFHRLRFEVTEEATAVSDGQRHAWTPTLGAFNATLGVHGDIMITENQIKHAIARDALGRQTIYTSLERLLGMPWDEELEVFRYASDDTPVRWLHQVV